MAGWSLSRLRPSVHRFFGRPITWTTVVCCWSSDGHALLKRRYYCKNAWENRMNNAQWRTDNNIFKNKDTKYARISLTWSECVSESQHLARSEMLRGRVGWRWNDCTSGCSRAQAALRVYKPVAGANTPQRHYVFAWSGRQGAKARGVTSEQHTCQGKSVGQSALWA